MENTENSDVMEIMPRYFWRRVFAYFIDLLMIALFFTVLAVAINSVFKTNLMAPSIVNSKYCKQANFLSKERFNKIFPEEPGVTRNQIVCKITTMGITSYLEGILVWESKDDKSSFRKTLSLPIDSKGNRVEIFSLDPLMYLVAPLFFALLISRGGSTIGKRWMGLRVVDKLGEIPNLKTALKREYIKGAIFVLGSLSGFYEIYFSYGLQFEEAGDSLKSLDSLISASGGFAVLIAIGAFIGLAIFWFTFGSFIRWRGQTYWDRWTRLFVNRKVKQRPPAVSARSQTKI